MEYHNLIIRKEKRIGFITINRPEVRNALNTKTWEELYIAARSFESDDGINVVIITGAGGKAFASGADIKTLHERKMLDVLSARTQDVLLAIEELRKPVIAAIDGYALGGGCELAMACDIRIASSKSRLGQPEVNLGVIPGGGGTQRLTRLVGMAKAKELIFTGRILTAEEALGIGLVNEVVSEDPIAAAKEMANIILEKAPVAISLAKYSINAGVNEGIAVGLKVERLAQTVVFGTEDRIEGTEAFLEKRNADFKGK